MTAAYLLLLPLHVAATCAEPVETWLLHHRRSGSTSLRNWLANLSGPKRWFSLQVSPRYFNDTASVTPACWDLGARYRALGRPAPCGAATVTHLREPLARVASEFAYRGPAGDAAEAWRAWLSPAARWSRDGLYGPPGGPRARWAPVDDYYVRSLAPRGCGAACVPGPAFGRMGTLGCEVAWPPPRLGDGDLRRAMDAVEGHVDAVVVAELSGDPALHAWLLEDVLGGCVRPEAPRRPPSMNARKARFAAPPAAVLPELRRRNALDLALYAWARNRTAHLINKSR